MALVLGSCSEPEVLSFDDAALTTEESSTPAPAAALASQEAERARLIQEQAAAAEAARVAAAAAQAAQTQAAAAEAQRVDEARRAAEEAEVARQAAARAEFEATYPLHGLTFHFLSRIRAQPRPEARVVGYTRRGARFRVTERVGTNGCARGWYEIVGGGYVCREHGYLIAREPPTFEPVPAPPALDSALPYAYAFAPRDTVQYWRVPSDEEEQLVRETLTALHAEKENPTQNEAIQPEDEAALRVEAPPPPGSEGSEEEGAGDPALAVTDGLAESLAGALADAVSGLVAEEPEELKLPDFVRMEMLRGFYVSLDDVVEENGSRYYRTIRGGYVDATKLERNDPSTHRGVVLGDEWQLPVAFVFRRGVRQLRRNQAGDRLRNAGRIATHTPLAVVSEFTQGQRDYIEGHDGKIVRRGAVRLARPVERPEDVPEGAQFIHVDLSEQTLVAYDGDRAAFATAVSTGRAGHDTPTGVFRVMSKHVSTTMDDLESDAPYQIEDVPWTMYFEGNFALHGAFWHTQFGRPRSHGCVNLAPADARWLFGWTEPNLPPGWHGMFAPVHDPGTYVYITE